MQGEGQERWELLCKLATEEQDPDKLLKLAAAIDRILKEKFERLDQQKSETKTVKQPSSGAHPKPGPKHNSDIG